MFDATEFAEQASELLERTDPISACTPLSVALGTSFCGCKKQDPLAPACPAGYDEVPAVPTSPASRGAMPALRRPSTTRSNHAGSRYGMVRWRRSIENCGLIASISSQTCLASSWRPMLPYSDARYTRDISECGLRANRR